MAMSGTLGFFLVPAVLPIFFEQGFWAQRFRIKNLIFGIATGTVFTLAYYREFFIRHSAELFSQAPVGEIDSAGSLIVQDNAVPWLYYPLSILDSQSGLIIGSLMLVGLLVSFTREKSLETKILLSAVVFPLLLFTIIAKKQPYYLMPALVPLSVMATYFSRAALISIGFGFVSFLSLYRDLQHRQS